MKKIELFIDTEFLDFENTEIISIGITSCEENIYFENKDINFKKTSNPKFIQNVVKPLLNFSEFGLSLSEISYKLNHSLRKLHEKGYEEFHIMSDQIIDLRLFFELVDFESFTFKPIVFTEKFYYIEKSLNLEKNSVIDYFFSEQKAFFKINQLPEHHALYDAQANLYAYEKVKKLNSQNRPVYGI